MDLVIHHLHWKQIRRGCYQQENYKENLFNCSFGKQKRSETVPLIKTWESADAFLLSCYTTTLLSFVKYHSCKLQLISWYNLHVNLLKQLISWVLRSGAKYTQSFSGWVKLNVALEGISHFMEEELKLPFCVFCVVGWPKSPTENETCGWPQQNWIFSRDFRKSEDAKNYFNNERVIASGKWHGAAKDNLLVFHIVAYWSEHTNSKRRNVKCKIQKHCFHFLSKILHFKVIKAYSENKSLLFLY